MIAITSQTAIYNETIATQTWNLTVTSSETVVTMTDGMQTDAVLAFGTIFLCAIVCKHFATSLLLDLAIGSPRVSRTHSITHRAASRSR